MRNGIRGAKRRSKPWRTTRVVPEAYRRPDLVQREFTASAPNELWVADLTYLALLGGRGLPGAHRRRFQPDDRWLPDRLGHAQGTVLDALGMAIVVTVAG